MTFSLQAQLIPDGGDIYWSEEFQTMIESHLAWLKNHPTTYTIAVDDGDAYKYEGDFYGLLAAYRVPTQYHWVVMRMNGLRATTDYDSTKDSLLIPSYQTLADLVQVFATTYTAFA